MKNSTGDTLIKLIFALFFVFGLAQANDQYATKNVMKPANPFHMKSPESASSSAHLRWSELEIDPARLDDFKLLAEENVRETRRTEPGVLAFFWAAEKDQPHRIRVFEAYADPSAYRAHVQSPHFQKFRTGSGQMVTNRQLFEALPVMLGAKPQLPPPDALVRIAELEIDPARLDAYKAIVSEEVEASIRIEPGVFAIYAFALKDRPNQLRFYEIYADERAYLLHRESPHFRKYLDATQDMITARRLIETAPDSPSR